MGFIQALRRHLPGRSAALALFLLTLPEKTPASFTALAEDALRIEAQDAVAFLYTEFTEVSAKRLNWRWRVDKTIAPSPQDRVGRDDRPLAIHLWFPPPAAQRSLLDRLGGVFGYPAIGRVMTYVWGGTSERGTVIHHPHFDEGRLIILRGTEAQAGIWYDESIDFTADYRRAFGEAPPDRLYLAISADTDDLGGMSSARLQALRWEHRVSARVLSPQQLALRP